MCIKEHIAGFKQSLVLYCKCSLHCVCVSQWKKKSVHSKIILEIKYNFQENRAVKWWPERVIFDSIDLKMLVFFKNELNRKLKIIPNTTTNTRATHYWREKPNEISCFVIRLDFICFREKHEQKTVTLQYDHWNYSYDKYFSVLTMFQKHLDWPNTLKI